MDIGERMLPILPEVNKPKALKNMKKSILQQTQTTKEQKTVTFAGTKMKTTQKKKRDPNEYEEPTSPLDGFEKETEFPPIDNLAPFFQKKFKKNPKIPLLVSLGTNGDPNNKNNQNKNEGGTLPGDGITQETLNILARMAKTKKYRNSDQKSKNKKPKSSNAFSAAGPNLTSSVTIDDNNNTSKFDANMQSREVLTKSFQEGADEGGYLRDIVVKIDSIFRIPETQIPEKYHVYSELPVPATRTNGGAETLNFNHQKKIWEKRLFPSKYPSDRIEIFLLAKTMDEMLRGADEEPEQTPRNYVQYKGIMLDKMIARFEIHIKSLNEIARQEFIQCEERSVLMQKIIQFFKEIFDFSVLQVREEIYKSDDKSHQILHLERSLAECQEIIESDKKMIEQISIQNSMLLRERDDFKQRAETDYPDVNFIINTFQDQQSQDQQHQEQIIGQEQQQQLHVQAAGGKNSRGISQEYSDPASPLNPGAVKQKKKPLRADSMELLRSVDLKLITIYYSFLAIARKIERKLGKVFWGKEKENKIFAQKIEDEEYYLDPILKIVLDKASFLDDMINQLSKMGPYTQSIVPNALKDKKISVSFKFDPPKPETVKRKEEKVKTNAKSSLFGFGMGPEDEEFFDEKVGEAKSIFKYAIDEKEPGIDKKKKIKLVLTYLVSNILEDPEEKIQEQQKEKELIARIGGRIANPSDEAAKPSEVPKSSEESNVLDQKVSDLENEIKAKNEDSESQKTQINQQNEIINNLENEIKKLKLRIRQKSLEESMLKAVETQTDQEPKTSVITAVSKNTSIDVSNIPNEAQEQLLVAPQDTARSDVSFESVDTGPAGDNALEAESSPEEESPRINAQDLENQQTSNVSGIVEEADDILSTIIDGSSSDVTRADGLRQSQEYNKTKQEELRQQAQSEVPNSARTPIEKWDKNDNPENILKDRFNKEREKLMANKPQSAPSSLDESPTHSNKKPSRERNFGNLESLGSTTDLVSKDLKIDIGNPNQKDNGELSKLGPLKLEKMPNNAANSSFKDSDASSISSSARLRLVPKHSEEPQIGEHKPKERRNTIKRSLPSDYAGLGADRVVLTYEVGVQATYEIIEEFFEDDESEKSSMLTKSTNGDSFLPEIPKLSKKFADDQNKRNQMRKKLRRRLLVRNERLALIIKSFQAKKQTVRPKSLFWVLKFMTSIYKAKVEKLTQNISFPEFVFEFLKHSYGHPKMVDEYATSIYATVTEYRKKDDRIKVFDKFLTEEFDINLFNVFIKVWKALEETKQGPEFASRPYDENPTKLERVSKIRCLFVLNAIKEEIFEILDMVMEELDKLCETVTEERYFSAMSAAGYNMGGSAASFFSPKELWGVDDKTARQVIEKSKFYSIITQAWYNFYIVKPDEALKRRASMRKHDAILDEFHEQDPKTPQTLNQNSIKSNLNKMQEFNSKNEPNIDLTESVEEITTYNEDMDNSDLHSITMNSSTIG